MPRSPRAQGAAAESLVAVAPLVTRWIERLLAAHDPSLTLPQYLALRAIERERLPGSELALRTGVSRPAVSQLIAGLAAAELVERRQEPDDRRRHQLVLSATGERAFRSAEALLRDRLADILGELPRPEADALARLLPRIEAIFSGAPPPRRPPPRLPHPPRPREPPAQRQAHLTPADLADGGGGIDTHQP